MNTHCIYCSSDDYRCEFPNITLPSPFQTSLNHSECPSSYVITLFKHHLTVNDSGTYLYAINSDKYVEVTVIVEHLNSKLYIIMCVAIISLLATTISIVYYIYKNAKSSSTASVKLAGRQTEKTCKYCQGKFSIPGA